MSKLVARTRPRLNMGSPNPTQARKKVARPSPIYCENLKGGCRTMAKVDIAVSSRHEVSFPLYYTLLLHSSHWYTQTLI